MHGGHSVFPTRILPKVTCGLYLSTFAGPKIVLFSFGLVAGKSRRLVESVFALPHVLPPTPQSASKRKRLHFSLVLAIFFNEVPWEHLPSRQLYKVGKGQERFQSQYGTCLLRAGNNSNPSLCCCNACGVHTSRYITNHIFST